jgi:phosphatidylglycerol:prolipoprotein diacylglycerol transferase
MLFALPFPAIDPVLVEIGPLAIRWYALSYVAGLFIGWWYILKLNKRGDVLTREQIDDLFVWVALGVILGGRIGYILFYGLDRYLAEPMEMIKVWKGGMSFHGGLVGVGLALILFSRLRKVPLWRLSDLMACTAPIGLFLGRIANFINGELWGRPTLQPWGMVFPTGGNVPRHPSQLYEAFLEGILLFSILAVLYFFTRAKDRPGLLTGVFLLGYGLSRAAVELVREPDAGLIMGLTRGQALSLPMIAVGLFLIQRAIKAAGDNFSRKKGE